MRNCAWCGSWHGVGRVRVNGVESPFPLFLCYRCFGHYAESGQRPSMPPPPSAVANTIDSVPLTADLLRRLR